MDSPSQPTNQPVLQIILDHPFSTLEKAGFPAWLKANSHNYLVGEHPPARRKLTHCHILLEGLKVTRESLRKAILKCCDGKKQYAVMTHTQEGHLPYDQKLLAKYIIKSDLTYVKSTSFDDAYLAIRASEWVKPESQQGVLNAELTTAKTKKSQPTIYQRCQDILDNELSHLVNRGHEEGGIDVFNIKKGMFYETAQNRSEIVKGIITYANRVGIGLHSIQVMNYYDVLLCNACPEYYKTLCVDLINRRHR